MTLFNCIPTLVKTCDYDQCAQRLRTIIFQAM